MTSIESQSQWPPPYTLTENSRVRSIKIKISSKTGLAVVIHPSFNVKKIPLFLNKHQAWIEKNLEKVRTKIDAYKNQTRPLTIHLEALGQTWRIFYTHLETNKATLEVDAASSRLHIWGNMQKGDAYKKVLIMWLKDQAHPYLLSRLEKISKETKLKYSQFSLRGQKTRWGSCSSKGSIQLNYKMIFLQSQLIDHIIIHELCHTVHLNHSVKFWRLVAAFDADWKKHHLLIRQVEKEMPLWLD